ncbi:similar to Saccharomyces cerevisiae YBR083W TEC1 Transcription factor required for full Ty1 expression [Maudiozyma saulgeensis]|uniref:Similar to Saccharomyces cerevisiae YBR083W TEC1 Transcription factor required for full Ty1 expression n=1 Tax=Maudiozyma saulgeensis TaxID=1789683 RepID=A0A1X7R896_9SACH|nr:similar to Saccharomyces cerevisiae YBR083W TEC1 Transcription factor required for full Ty1 expression [Kazachstania saulgeensis]
MSHENNEQLIDSENNINSRKRKYFDVYSSRSSSLNPTQSRVFDVFVNNTDSPQNLQLLDIFSDEMKSKENRQNSLMSTTFSSVKTEKDIDDLDDIPLLNSGKLSNSNTLQLNAFNDPKKLKIPEEPKSRIEDKLGDKPMLPSSNVIKSPKSMMPSHLAHITAHNTHSSALYLKDSYDKWSNNVEEVFIKALRLVMKNGTSKIKLKDRNYGRNELISLYIKYYTGEFRTKKQISSHIQVWKKAILNKISNNIQITEMDQELLTLIEEGAQQTKDSTKLFYETFDVILSKLKPSPDGSDYVSVYPHTSQTMVNNTDEIKSTYGGAIHATYPTESQAISNYPDLITPKSAPTSASQQVVQNYKTLEPQPFQTMNNYPITPLDYAKSLYENMKSYKCVPAKIEDDSYTSFLKDIQGNKNDSTMGANIGYEKHESNGRISSRINSENVIKNAERVKAEQRKLIEELQRKSKTNASVDLPSIGNRSASNSSFYDRVPFSQDDLTIRPKDWETSKETSLSLYMMPQSQSQMPPQLQRSISGNSIPYQQEMVPPYLQQQAQQQVQQPTLYPGQYLVPLTQQQQQQQQASQVQSQQGLTLSKMSPQGTFISYPQPAGSQASVQQGVPSSSVYYYPRHTYIPSSNPYPNGPYRSNQSIPYNDLPFEQFPNGSQEFE